MLDAAFVFIVLSHTERYNGNQLTVDILDISKVLLAMNARLSDLFVVFLDETRM